MSEFVINEDLFGRYCKIKQGYSGEKHIYKIVNTFESNTYKDVPLKWDKEEYIHNGVIPVLTVIHCGIDETNCEIVALKDVEILESKFISKSKIKEKIEEIQNKFECVNGWDSEFNYSIEVLQELMEDK